MLERVFENDGLVVFNKPSGVSVLRDRSGAANLWEEINRERKHYLVHRLDKGTSGAFIVAKTQATQSVLTKAFEQRTVSKHYLAWVVGDYSAHATHTIDLPLKKGRKSRYRVAGLREHIQFEHSTWRLKGHPDHEGLQATTRIRVLKQTGRHTLLLAKPLTGRTHQLRVHLSWIGYPIVGDHLYGRPKDPLQAHERLLLHCHRLVVPEILSAQVAPIESGFPRSV